MSSLETTTNEVLATKLDYIQRDISTINKNIAEIKADNISRREFETHIKDFEDKMASRFLLVDQAIKEVAKDTAWSTKIIYGVLTLVLGSILTAAMKLILQ